MIVFCCVLPASNKARDDDDDHSQQVNTAASVHVVQSVNQISVLCS